MHNYNTAASDLERKADYEKRYSQFKQIPQPQLKDVKLNVELYTAKRAMDIRGTYRLVNTYAVAIDSIHIGAVPGADIKSFVFDRPADHVVTDNAVGYHIFFPAKAFAAR